MLVNSMTKIRVRYTGEHPAVRFEGMIFKRMEWREIEKPKRPLPSDFDIGGKHGRTFIRKKRDN